MSFYLNNIYYGSDQYTIESAANYYFGTTVNKNSDSMSQITVLQSAILASKVNAPSVYDISNMSDNFKIELKQTLKNETTRIYI